MCFALALNVIRLLHEDARNNRNNYNTDTFRQQWIPYPAFLQMHSEASHHYKIDTN
jgi:hypothetical protein